MKLLNKYINKGGVGSGRRPENKLEQPKQQRPTRRFGQKPSLGRKLGHVLSNVGGGALQGSILGSLAGPIGTKAGTVAGALYGGVRGVRNVLRGKVPKISAGREAIEQGVDAATTYGLSRFPYRRAGRAMMKPFRRR